MVYVEPYCGSASILFGKRPHPAEIINDLDGLVVNFFRVLQHRRLFRHFAHRVRWTPYSRDEYNEALRVLAQPFEGLSIDHAWAFFVQGTFSFSGGNAAGWRRSTQQPRDGVAVVCWHWRMRIELLEQWRDRLTKVQIEHRPALEIIADYDSSATTFYLDPPYVGATRTAPDMYAHEMTDMDHLALVETLRQVKGRVVLSGYASPHYDPLIREGWLRLDKPLLSRMARKDATGDWQARTEVLWINRLAAPSLLDGLEDEGIRAPETVEGSEVAPYSEPLTFASPADIQPPADPSIEPMVVGLRQTGTFKTVIDFALADDFAVVLDSAGEAAAMHEEGSLFDALESEQRRDEGIAKASLSTPEDVKAAIFAAWKTCCIQHKEVTSDNLWTALDNDLQSRIKENVNIIGAVIRESAKDLHWIRPTGTSINTARPSGQARKIVVWQSLLYKHSAPSPPTPPVTVTTPPISLAQFLNTQPAIIEPDWHPQAPLPLDGIDEIALNVETDGLDWRKGDRPISIAICSLDGQHQQFLPFRFTGGNLDEATVKRWAERELRGKHITNANTRFDVHMLREWGIDLEAQGCTVSDEMHWVALLEDHRKRFGLDILIQDFLKHEEPPARVDERYMTHHHASDVAVRAQYQVEVIAKLRDELWERLDKEDLQQVRQLEDEVIYPVCEMEKNGSPIDEELCGVYSRTCMERHDALMMEVKQEISFPFEHTAAGWQQLFEHLNLPSSKSYAEEIIDTIDHPTVKKAHRAAQYASLNS
ncbi:MAG TPA: DNA adenine methylase, partial [Mesorhizobium sp.]|nr:DNA adenine methylase [Mesorhizobium sp.]